MQTNTIQEHYLDEKYFDTYDKNQLIELIGKWLKEQKRNRKEKVWSSLMFSLAKMIIPDLHMEQMLLGHEFFLEKISYLIGLCKFRTQVLFHGVEIKLGEAFIAFDTECRLQKVTLQGTQIKQVTPTEPFIPITRFEMTCEDRKQRMLIYNRQKSRPSTFLTIELKALERTKNELFKEDHINKMRFLTSFVFGEYCPSFSVSGVHMMRVRENEWMGQKMNLEKRNVYLICDGTFVCFLEKISQKASKDNNDECNDSIRQVQASSRLFKSKKSHRNNSTFSVLSSGQDYINKIELNKGSIIESGSFQEILIKLGQQPAYKFQSCKAITNSMIFEIKCSQFNRAINMDERCKEYFLRQYQKVIMSRKLLFSESLSTLNNFFCQTERHSTENELAFSIFRRKNYKGFRSARSTNRNTQDMQSLATIEIYETMIRNKQKVLSIQKEYKNKKKSTVQKSNIRYEDNRKLKENYKRMKIKDFQIQKLVFTNSVSNIKDSDGIKNVKSRFGQVKGMFQDEVQEVEKIIKQQRRTMLVCDSNREMFKRKTARLKSYSPQTSNPSYFQQSLTYSRTCQNSQRGSLNPNLSEDLFREVKEENGLLYLDLSENQIYSRSSIREDKKMTQNLPQTYEIMIGGLDSKKYLYSPVNCDKMQRDVRDMKRSGKKVRTFVKHARKEDRVLRASNFQVNSRPNMTVTSFVKLF